VGLGSGRGVNACMRCHRRGGCVGQALHPQGDCCRNPSALKHSACDPRTLCASARQWPCTSGRPPHSRATEHSMKRGSKRHFCAPSLCTKQASCLRTQPLHKASVLSLCTLPLHKASVISLCTLPLYKAELAAPLEQRHRPGVLQG